LRGRPFAPGRRGGADRDITRSERSRPATGEVELEGRTLVLKRIFVRNRRQADPARTGRSSTG
jgi:hypothetical protein